MMTRGNSRKFATFLRNSGLQRSLMTRNGTAQRFTDGSGNDVEGLLTQSPATAALDVGLHEDILHKNAGNAVYSR